MNKQNILEYFEECSQELGLEITSIIHPTYENVNIIVKDQKNQLFLITLSVNNPQQLVFLYVKELGELYPMFNRIVSMKNDIKSFVKKALLTILQEK